MSRLGGDLTGVPRFLDGSTLAQSIGYIFLSMPPKLSNSDQMHKLKTVIIRAANTRN